MTVARVTENTDLRYIYQVLCNKYTGQYGKVAISNPSKVFLFYFISTSLNATHGKFRPLGRARLALPGSILSFIQL